MERLDRYERLRERRGGRRTAQFEFDAGQRGQTRDRTIGDAPYLHYPIPWDGVEVRRHDITRRGARRDAEKKSLVDHIGIASTDHQEAGWPPMGSSSATDSPVAVVRMMNTDVNGV